MHQLYESEAYVLRSAPQGEADAHLVLFTEQFGLLHARAQGLRYEKSKLRFAVQPYSRMTASLVRGKGVWRLTNAQAGQNVSAIAPPYALAAVARIFSLLERLLSSESVDSGLFTVVDMGVRFLSTCTDRSTCKAAEVLLVLRILYVLGYVGNAYAIETFVQTEVWTEELLVRVEQHKKELVHIINVGLQESQL